MSNQSLSRVIGFVLLAIYAFAATANSVARAQEAAHALTIRDGKFEPSTLQVRAGEKFKLTITNATAKPSRI